MARRESALKGALREALRRADEAESKLARRGYAASSAEVAAKRSEGQVAQLRVALRAREKDLDAARAMLEREIERNEDEQRINAEAYASVIGRTKGVCGVNGYDFFFFFFFFFLNLS
jgi:hypothetical protein